jgi:hypothetical protein
MGSDMIIERIERVDIDGYPGLAVVIDRKEALFTTDLKRTILEKYNAVFLGDEFEDDYQVKIPADEEDGISAQTLKGFSDDPKIVELVREWLKAPS